MLSSSASKLSKMGCNAVGSALMKLGAGVSCASPRASREAAAAWREATAAGSVAMLSKTARKAVLVTRASAVATMAERNSLVWLQSLLVLEP